jgi:hypothetical protein
MQEILFIVLLLAVIGYWWDTMVTNELALQACRRICQNSQMQLLDGTIMRQRIWLRRSPSGGVQICRLYSFEYSDDNASRKHGYIVTLGRQVIETRMEPRPVN